MVFGKTLYCHRASLYPGEDTGEMSGKPNEIGGQPLEGLASVEGKLLHAKKTGVSSDWTGFLALVPSFFYFHYSGMVFHQVSRTVLRNSFICVCKEAP